MLDEFEAIDTQVLGISVDSKFCHKAWSDSMGGIKFPLLADFHPKGAVCKAYGLWLENAGIGDRATIHVNKEGKVTWAESVGPAGRRDPKELLGRAKELAS